MEILRSRFKDKVRSIGVKSGLSSNPKLVDPDEKWSNVYRERQRNHLYKWVDVQHGGELLSIYDKDGEDGVQRFASEVLPAWLYNDGIMPEELKQEDYIRWRKFMHANLTGGDDISQSDILDSIGGHFYCHTALWKLNKRGIDGETLIHLLLSKEDAKYTEIAKVIVRVYPGLAADIFEGEEFYGQSPLHLAISQDDFDCLRFMVEAGADISQRATGKFFLPEDQKRNPKSKCTNYAGFAYYGEYPLAFAASFGNKDIYDFLIEHGADPNAHDSFGNTVLHMCVINNSIEMYSYAVRHWSRPADVNICNNAGYTPLTLATILGRREIFEAMLELTKVEYWRFSDITYSAYPLTTLDTIRPDGSTNWESALMRVVNGTTTSHLEIVGGEVIQRLLADKWRLFGERKMYERLVFQVFHILCISLAVYTRSSNEPPFLWSHSSGRDFIRIIAEALTVISCLVYLLGQQTGEIRAHGVESYLRSMVQAPEKPIFLASNICILFCVPCRLMELYWTDEWALGILYLAEETFLILALPGFWLSLLFYAKGFLMTGPFVVMIYSMVAGDMVRFGILALIFLVSFSQGFYFLGKDIVEKQSLQYHCTYNDTTILDYEHYWETALTLFRMSLGGYDYEKLYCATYPPLAKILFVLFMIVWPIMLINMLIAMMGNTYERIIAHAEKAWRQQWAQIVILLERSLDGEKLAKLQGEYSINLNDDRFDDTSEAECIRALMVIKQTKQTRATQRKKATASWKRLARKVFSLLRNHGVDNTRQVLHNRGINMDSRPPSASAEILRLSQTSRANDRRSSYATMTSIGRAHSRIDDSPKKVARIVDTVRSTPVVPPLLHVPAHGYESPKFLVHQHHHQLEPVSRGRTPAPLDDKMLIRKLSMIEPKEPQQPSGSSEGNSTGVMEGMPAVPLSSPCSLSESDSTERNGTTFEGKKEKQSPISRKISSSSIQLQPVKMHQLLPHRPQTGGQTRPAESKNRRMNTDGLTATGSSDAAKDSVKFPPADGDAAGKDNVKWPPADTAQETTKRDEHKTTARGGHSSSAAPDAASRDHPERDRSVIWDRSQAASDHREQSRPTEHAPGGRRKTHHL